MEKKGLAIRIALFHLLTIKNDPVSPVYPRSPSFTVVSGLPVAGSGIRTIAGKAIHTMPALLRASSRHGGQRVSLFFFIH
jgi:hypothetical protein